MPYQPQGILCTDLYQLSMMQAYFREGMTDEAAFEFSVRKMPPNRNFLVAAGLEQCLDYLEGLAPLATELEWLRTLGRFDDEFLAWLAGLRFTGDVDAVPEGTVFFPDEPVLRVAAPMPVAQLVETRIINLLHFEILVASKAARMVAAAGGRPLVDFGCRRAHGTEAALLAARAAYIAGFSGTSTVEAARVFGIPLFGTVAHSYIQAHDHEEDAFVKFAHAHPHRLVLVIDTYDTRRGAVRVADLATRLAAEGCPVAGVRIDSGDIGPAARAVRAILDAAGHPEITIFATGGIDEGEIARLLADGAPVDGFGVGTSLATSIDAPALDCAYKLQEYGGVARRKRSEGKATWPGRRQVFRYHDSNRLASVDVVGLADETLPGTSLLAPAMRGGRRLGGREGLAQVRARMAEQCQGLPPELLMLDAAPHYPVVPSLALQCLADKVDRMVEAGAVGGE